MQELPTYYDAVVVGTGMIGSMVAAALSRVGKSVLHLDENDYYGEEWASFNLENLDIWLKSMKFAPYESTIDKNLIGVNESCVLGSRTQRVSGVQQQWFCQVNDDPKVCHEASHEIKNEVEQGDEQKIEQEHDAAIPSIGGDSIHGWTQQKLREEYRKFNLDLSPKMLYSRGSFVELLISSNIARYAEFKAVNRVLTWRNGRLEVVPCSRADVFSNKNVSVVQKRMLVKILSSFSDYPACKQELEAFKDKTFMEYLKQQKLDDQLIHYIAYAMAMGSTDTACFDGIERCQRFLLSLGRYGNTPFICPMYGAGELPQCFCRLCAVFGGIYHLKRGVDGYVLNEEGVVVAVISGGQRLETKQVIVTSSHCPRQFLQPDTQSFVYNRAIFITDKSIAESERDAITLLQFPPEQANEGPITIMEIGCCCQVCPPALSLVHMTSQPCHPSNSASPEETFRPARRALFRNEEDETTNDRPKVVWSLHWQVKPGNVTPSPECPPNFKICPGPDPGIDYDLSIAKAIEIFKELCPEEEFLPRAPDPDEIIMEDFASQTVEGGDVIEDLERLDVQGIEIENGETQAVESGNVTGELERDVEGIETIAVERGDLAEEMAIVQGVGNENQETPTVDIAEPNTADLNK